MVSVRRILLGVIAAAVGAILGCSLCAGTIHTLRATSRPNSPPPTPATAAVSTAPETPGGATALPATVSGTATEATQAFMALAQHLKAALKEAANSRPAAREAITSLQAFIAKYPHDPITDKAYLSMGNMLLSVGDSAGAIAAYEHVALTPNDASLGPVGTLFLGKAQAQAGRVDAARVTFRKLIAQEKDTQIGKAAAMAMNRLASMPGQRPPAFLMKDLDGHSQSPDLYRGKVLLIDFWATWCSPCREEMPNLKRVYARYKDHGFAVLGVSLDTDRDALQKCLQAEGITWPQLCDGRGPQGEIARQMGVVSIPTMLLVDKEGVIRFVDPRGPELEEAVGTLLTK
jgi:peroxiredoxin/predicted negative regulator of RcsB-dependent stress response